jgi:proline iminopeptidase
MFRAGWFFLLVVLIAFGGAVGGSLYAQRLYAHAYGDSTATPIVFLHGGPGYNSVSFEVTTARVLADHGYYVVLYDRRGEGRSPLPAAYTFAESVRDLDSLYGVFGLDRATLIGHSFGGLLATRFAEVHPERVAGVVLVGAPVSVPASLRNIRDRSRAHYTTQHDSVNLRYIELIDALDTASLDYASYLLAHAVQNGFYRPARLSPDADTLYAQLRRDPRYETGTRNSAYLPHLGFWTNERYTTLDQGPVLRRLVGKGIPVYGIYGLEDGLYSRHELDELEHLLGPDRFVRLAGASHNVFIDQQPSFLTLIREWVD